MANVAISARCDSSGSSMYSLGGMDSLGDWMEMDMVHLLFWRDRLSDPV